MAWYRGLLPSIYLSNDADADLAAKVKRCLCVCLEPRTRRAGGITVLPYRARLVA